MQRFLRIVGLFVLLLGVVGCTGDTAQPDDGYAFTLSVNPQQLQVGSPTRVTVAINDAGGQPVTNATVTMELTMSHAGMMSMQKSASEIVPGVYEVNADFDMGGEWIVIVKAELESGETIERTLALGNVNG